MKRIKSVKELHEVAVGGSNSDELIKKYVQNVARWKNEISEISGKIKDELNSAKQDGFLKTSIHNAVKNLRMSEDQRQARDEIDSETQRITELCADLPLFSMAA
jgi:uncharacterized protein (UPF0335 family)